MCHQNLADIPDDPYRVAPPYCAPGEVDPGDAPQVSDKEAARRVGDVLIDGHGTAFGLTAEDWEELLADYFISIQRAAFMALLAEKAPGTLALVKRHMEVFIGDQANDLLAEMDADALDREGFPV